MQSEHATGRRHHGRSERRPLGSIFRGQQGKIKPTRCNDSASNLISRAPNARWSQRQSLSPGGFLADTNQPFYCEQNEANEETMRGENLGNKVRRLEGKLLPVNRLQSVNLRREYNLAGPPLQINDRRPSTVGARPPDPNGGTAHAAREPHDVRPDGDGVQPWL